MMNADDPIIVVTGLPRSGTSLMMQALAAGGVPPLVDDRRRADADNPNGYFELDAVKQLMRDASFLHECRGRAVKIIAQLLPHLPPHLPYRIVAIHRDAREVVASQRAMLTRLGKPGARIADAQLAEILEAQFCAALTAVAQLPHAEVLHVKHATMIHNSVTAFACVATFLGRDALDIDTMARCVDPALYRQRAQHI